MKQNFLKLNDDKTEVLIITSRQSLSDSLDISVQVGDQKIPPSDTPHRNLGVIFDSSLSLKSHITNICKSINFNLYSIGKIRKCLDRSTTEKIVNACITSRLDYCNSLLCEIPKVLRDKLQLCQNSAARLITRSRKYDHITPILVDLHWLPVEYRIKFKIMLITYKALHDLAPLYIKELLSEYVPSRGGLRSSSHLNMLSENNYSNRLATAGGRSYSVVAPRLWNALPRSLRDPKLSLAMFKKGLKTHYFYKSYFS